MDKVQIGENAGIVWRTLENKGSLSFDELQVETKLNQLQLFTAIGWLARENKISFNKENDIMSVRLYQERYY
jgi:hypothetical protein